MERSAGEAVFRRQGEAGFAGSTARDAAWIFRNDVRRTWVSFPAAAVVAALLGLYAGGFLLSGRALDGPARWILAPLRDFWFLAVTPALAVNLLFNRDYYYRFSGDNLSRRLVFLRGLPISAAALVAARVAYMLMALAVSAPAFFTTAYLTSGVLRDRLGGAGYPSFAAIWCGYALLMGGLYVFLWHAVAWKVQLRVIPVLVVVYPILAVFLSLVIQDGLVAWTIRAAAARGSLAAAVALAVGAAGMVAWAAATTRRLERRDLP